MLLCTAAERLRGLACGQRSAAPWPPQLHLSQRASGLPCPVQVGPAGAWQSPHPRGCESWGQGGREQCFPSDQESTSQEQADLPCGHRGQEVEWRQVLLGTATCHLRSTLLWGPQNLVSFRKDKEEAASPVRSCVPGPWGPDPVACEDPVPGLLGPVPREEPSALWCDGLVEAPALATSAATQRRDGTSTGQVGAASGSWPHSGPGRGSLGLPGGRGSTMVPWPGVSGALSWSRAHKPGPRASGSQSCPRPCGERQGCLCPVGSLRSPACTVSGLG